MGWILLIALFIAVNRYFHMRIEWEKTTYIRAYLGAYVYDKGFLVMIFAGIVLLILQHFEVITIPELVNRIHLIRTGIISFIAVCFFYWWDGYLDEDEGLAESEVGDEELEDVDSLDA